MSFPNAKNLKYNRQTFATATDIYELLMTTVVLRICRLIVTSLMSFKRCHLSFVYFLLYKELSYVLTRAILEQVARNRAPVSKKNPRNGNNQQLSRLWKRFLEPCVHKAVRKRESTSASACFASFLTNRVIILRKLTFKCKRMRTTFVIA